MRESISIPIAISIPTNPRPLEPSIMKFQTSVEIMKMMLAIGT